MRQTNNNNKKINGKYNIYRNKSSPLNVIN